MDALKNLVMNLDLAQTLTDENLTEAFHLLFGPDWKKHWKKKDKANEMKSIFKGATMPCVAFKNWVKCINYLDLIQFNYEV